MMKLIGIEYKFTGEMQEYDRVECSYAEAAGILSGNAAGIDLSESIAIIELNSCQESAWELIERARKITPLIRFILIAKEKDFDIAYRAVTCKIDQLLIEPVSQVQLQDAIEKCRSELVKSESINTDLQKLQEYELRKHQQMMEKVLGNILEKPEEVERLLWEINDRYDIHLGKENYQVILINVDEPSLFLPGSTFVQKTMQLAEASFSNSMEAISAYLEEYGIVVILNLPERFSRELYEGNMQRLCSNIEAMQEEFCAYHFVLSVGKIVHSMREINASLEQAMGAKTYAFVTDKKILYANKMPDLAAEVIFPDASLRNLYRLASLRDQEQVTAWFAQLRSDLLGKYRYMPCVYTQIRKGIEEYLHSVCRDNSELLEDMQIWRWKYLLSGEELVRALEASMFTLMKFQNEHQEKEKMDTFAEAVAYMKEHLGEPISLEEVAARYEFSSSYFSRMLKERMGQNYLEILTDLRVEKAQQLLCETKKPISQIVEETGYQDEKYFRRLFKQKTGQTPSAFRKAHEV